MTLQETESRSAKETLAPQTRQHVWGSRGNPRERLGFQAVRPLTLHESAERGSCRSPLL